jgi:hypothetical protein
MSGGSSVRHLPVARLHRGANRQPGGGWARSGGSPPMVSSILKGGYVVYESAGKEQQKFGDEFPEWRKQMKAGPLARTRRRLVQAADL